MALCECGCGQEIIWKPRQKYYNVRFIKGHNTRGIKRPEETMRKIIESRRANKGWIISENTRKKLRNSHLGQPAWNKGKIGIYSYEVRKRISETLKNKPNGANHPNWKGGINVSRARTYKNNLKFRLRRIISSYINHSLKGNKNGRHWESLVGWTLGDLKKHLEKQFTEGMNWDNYGRNGWHIDHVIPVSVFNFDSPEHIDFKKCWALENLQPMWAEENRIKQDKLSQSFQPSLKLKI